MGDKSSIQWTDATWTPIRARVKQDAAEIAQQKGYTSFFRNAKGVSHPVPSFQPGKVGPHCEMVSPGCENCYSQTNNSRCLPNNGTGLPFDRRARDLVDIFVDENILAQPLKWRTPKKVFVCSQTDLFGEWVTDEMIDRVFAVMALRPDHTFQVLTKRAERMKEYVCRVSRVLLSDSSWPLPNVWLGVSVENQEQADKRIPLLLQTPAAVRWISAEPLLGPVDLNKRELLCKTWRRGFTIGTYLDWVVVGGESGTGARPMNPAWARTLRDQCVESKVSFFFKQWGAWKPSDAKPIRGKHTGGGIFLLPNGRFGNQGDFWDGYASPMDRVGKKDAGRLLDGREWNEYPER